MADITFAKASKKTNKRLVCKYVQDGVTCGKIFYGYPNTKYCKYHQDPKNRNIILKKISFDITTFTFKHKFSTTKEIERQCDAPGCHNTYRIIIYPDQFEYPRYCEHHRNKWKRDLFLKKHSKD